VATVAPRPTLLITGAPGVGKTTLVERVIDRLGEVRARGFVTREMRRGGQRVGFRVESLDGRAGVLAEAGRRRSGPRVGRYTVRLDEFEAVALPALDPVGADLIVIDEVGKMECFSQPFIEAVRRVLRSPVALLATVALKGRGLIAEIKAHPGVRLIEIDRGTRDETAQAIAAELTAAL
jgi:nucleoside-triphosphatase